MLTWFTRIGLFCAIGLAGASGIYANQGALPGEPACRRISVEKKGNNFIPSLTMDPAAYLRQSAPNYWKVTFSRSGAAEFKGSTGQFDGSVPAPDFANLCRVALKNLPVSANYGVRSDRSHEQVTTMEIESGSAVVTVVEIGTAAPVDVWAFERAVESVAFHVNWTKK